MNLSLSFIKSFFLLISISIATAYTTTLIGLNATSIALGLFGGALFSLAMMGLDLFLKRFNLHAFNVAMLGIFFGYLMGEALYLLANTLFDFSNLPLSVPLKNLIKTSIFLFSTYFGMSMTARASEEFYISLPFVRFKPTHHKKKDLLVDLSILQDPRILDLAGSGLLDNQLILPRFTLKELQHHAESGHEMISSRARRSLEVFKKLENMAHLDLRYIDTDFHNIQDPMTKMVRLARLLDANIITSDINRIQQSTVEGVSIININTLANALKPISQAGEFINIKIQHPGKGARQGVGYLEDGTMVVINGGADHIGETIKAQVLSVKHTSSGRMIFCNSTDENLLSDQESLQSVATLDQSHKSYFVS